MQILHANNSFGQSDRFSFSYMLTVYIVTEMLKLTKGGESTEMQEKQKNESKNLGSSS